MKRYNQVREAVGLLLVGWLCGVPALTIEGYHPADSVPVDTSLHNEHPRTYSFEAGELELRSALRFFARANDFELICDTTLEGTVTTSFKDVALETAMEQLLADTKSSWYLSGNTLRILSFENGKKIERRPDNSERAFKVIEMEGARIFKIDYPRLKRTGQGSSTATISSTASGEAGSIALSTNDEILFWQELEEQLRQLISPKGKLIISKMSGIVHVSDNEDVLDRVETFIHEVVRVATRQVEITARIYEVSLDKDHSLGVDWSAVEQTMSLKGITGAINGGIEVIRSTTDMSVATTKVDLTVDDKLAMLVNALKEQGDVQAVSQPRILTLNNQPALIKIGTDYPFFSANVTTNATTGQREVEEEVKIITVGVVLSVTPQISADGWITLGIDPLISDLVSTEQSENGSTAPVVDVKQSSALVRLRDQSTVRISGLLQRKKRTITRKVPLLGEIPLLKYLFQWTYTKENQRELIIFITPREIKR
jgi:MSHA biogenesis protein MshL